MNKICKTEPEKTSRRSGGTDAASIAVFAAAAALVFTAVKIITYSPDRPDLNDAAVLAFEERIEETEKYT
ncbi:MAG: hypothetical protein PUE85_04665 [Firmicutes bacterium]|nr:hypothetical protein [Bacillota bacterium]